MQKLSFFIIALVLADPLISQTPSWKILPNSPSTNWRQDDLSFINEKTGWVTYNTVFGSGNNGRIYKTTDGGISWVQQLNVTNIYLRCIGFMDSLIGFIGTLGNISGLNASPIYIKLQTAVLAGIQLHLQPTGQGVYAECLLLKEVIFLLPAELTDRHFLLKVQMAD